MEVFFPSILPLPYLSLSSLLSHLTYQMLLDTLCHICQPMNSAKIKMDPKQEVPPAKSNHCSGAIILQRLMKAVLHFKFLT